MECELGIGNPMWRKRPAVNTAALHISGRGNAYDDNLLQAGAGLSEIFVVGVFGLDDGEPVTGQPTGSRAGRMAAVSS